MEIILTYTPYPNTSYGEFRLQINGHAKTDWQCHAISTLANFITTIQEASLIVSTFSGYLSIATTESNYKISFLWWERMRKNILSILQIPLDSYPVSDIMLERKVTINV